MKTHTARPVTPRSLQEWMERECVTAERLIQLVKHEAGHDISRTALSFLLTGSRRCSVVNAAALSAVTGVPASILRQWPRVSKRNKLSGRRSRLVA